MLRACNTCTEVLRRIIHLNTSYSLMDLTVGGKNTANNRVVCAAQSDFLLGPNPEVSHSCRKVTDSVEGRRQHGLNKPTQPQLVGAGVWLCLCSAAWNLGMHRYHIVYRPSTCQYWVLDKAITHYRITIILTLSFWSIFFFRKTLLQVLLQYKHKIVTWIHIQLVS